MLELKNDEQCAPDELFFERFEAFMDKSMADIKAFSEREDRPFEETRKYVAQWHSKYLFQPRFPEPLHHSEAGGIDRPDQTRNVLLEASRILESLHEVSGIESFLLAVDPHNSTDEGFLGGSLAGREFWRGLRGGADYGARAFKMHCMKRLEAKPRTGENVQGSNGIDGPSSATSLKHSAKSIKLELYERVRKALRHASGIRNAEMKWTNPDRLLTYGVYLVGWPEDIPAQNPSTLKASQNKRLLDLLENGTMKFVRNVATASSSTSDQVLHSPDGKSSPIDDEPDALFSWAIQYEENSPSSSQPSAEINREPATASTPDQLLNVLEAVPERPRKRPKRFGGEILRFSTADDA